MFYYCAWRAWTVEWCKRAYCNSVDIHTIGEMRLPHVLACLACLLVSGSCQRNDFRTPGLAQDLGQLFSQTVNSLCPYGRLPVRPGPLTAVQATPTSRNRARITWRSPANQACYRFVDLVIQSPGLRDERRRSSRNGEVLRNLDPRRVYTITLVPVSALFGAGPPVRVQVQTGRPVAVRPTDCIPDERRAPAPVTDLTVTTDVGPGALRIRFNPAKSGSCATSFLIQLIEPGTPPRIIFNAPTELTDPVVNRLKEGQKYIVAVIPTNSAGGGQSVRKEATTTSAARRAAPPPPAKIATRPANVTMPPPPAKVATPPPSPPPPSPPPKAGCVAGSTARAGPVANLSAAAGGKPSSEALLRWLAPVTGGCPVSYLVDGFVVENPVPVIREMPTTATARNFTGLLPNTRYRFVVTGISSGGQRSTAQQVLITTAGSDCDTSGAASPPSPVNVTAVSNSTSAFTLNWLATTTGPCAKKYLVEVDEGTRRVFRRELTALTVNVPGLKPATNYTYRVFALNDAGDSDPVGGVVATQGLCDPTLIPSAVTNLTATPGATVGVVVAWGPPRNKACVRTYQVRIQQDSPNFLAPDASDVSPSLPDGSNDPSGASGGVLRYTGTPNTTYIFQVTPVGFTNATGTLATVTGSTPAVLAVPAAAGATNATGR